MSTITATEADTGRPSWGWVSQFWIDSETDDDMNTFYTNDGDAAVGARKAIDIPHPETILGTVVVFVSLDGDHHEVHVDAYNCLGDLGAVKQAITELERVAARLEQFEALA